MIQVLCFASGVALASFIVRPDYEPETKVVLFIFSLASMIIATFLSALAG